MQIVDTHCHVIARDDPRYPQYHVVHFDWVDPHAVDFEQFLTRMDAAGVQKATLVQSISGHGYDNRYTMDCVRRYPERFSGVGVIDPLEPDAAETVRRLIEDDGMRAVRLFSNHQGVEAFALDDERTYPVWEVAAAAGIPVILYIQYKQLDQLSRVVKRFSQIPVAVDHVAMAPVKDGPPFKEAAPLMELASHPNLYLKWSTNILDSCDDAGVPFIEFFRQLIDHYGAERLLWGSNYPARSQPSYQGIVERALQAIAPLSSSEQDLVMGGSALTFWPELA